MKPSCCGHHSEGKEDGVQKDKDSCRRKTQVRFQSLSNVHTLALTTDVIWENRTAVVQTLYCAEDPVDGEIVHVLIIVSCGVSLIHIQQQGVLCPEGKPVVGEDTGGVVEGEDDQHHHTSQRPHPLTVLRKHRPLHLHNINIILLIPVIKKI